MYGARALHLSSADLLVLLERQGPSLALWRAAEVAALREQSFPRPVLDLGCGDGLVTSMVLPAVELGVDPWPPALARARALGLYRELVPASVQDARIPPETIGTIISNSVLEHIGAIRPVLAAIARLLRPRGRLIFTVPTEAFSTGLAVPIERYRSWRNRTYQHLNLWPVERWADELQRVGLAVERVRPYLRPHLVRLWDVLELPQQLRLARCRPFGVAWRRLPVRLLERLAQQLSTWDFAALPPGGGRLIVAQKIGA